MKSYAIIGLGRFGSRIATRLYQLDEEVLAIDKHEDNVNEVSDSVTRAVVADARNKNVLKSLGVAHCDVAIVALGSDLAASVLTTMNLKSLGVPKVICKAHDETHREILEKLGADKVVIPEHVVADKLARTLTSPDIMEYIDVSDDYGIVEYKAQKAWIGKTIRELNFRARYGVNIIAIKENDKVKVSPTAEYRITDDAVLVLLGDYASLEKI